MITQIIHNDPEKTHEMLKRLFSFLLVGGFGAVVNLVCFSCAYYALGWPANRLLAYASAFVIATEVSILVNFMLNDRFTFRQLHDRGSAWQARCMRYHVTSVGGTLVTLGISFSLVHVLHVPALFAQAMALVVATVFNFVAHHVFTYAAG